jgi:hypothetical protein
MRLRALNHFMKLPTFDPLPLPSFHERQRFNPATMIQSILQYIAAKLDNPLIPWKRLVVGFSLAQFAFENWLLWRQYGVYSRTVRPKTIEKEVDQATFDKSQVTFPIHRVCRL